MVTTDDRGFVKYWQSNFNNVHTFQAHSDPVKCSRLEVDTVLLHSYKHHILMGPYSNSAASTVITIIAAVRCLV